MKERRIVITGGLGFIGANLIEYWRKQYPNDQLFNLDCRSYASSDLAKSRFDGMPKYQFIPIDLRDRVSLYATLRNIRPHGVIHLAAESHVCRSIEGPEKFTQSNVMGTQNLLDTFYKYRQTDQSRFHLVSTDEVFGELPLDAPHERFTEETPFDPKSPYAASKAAAHYLVKAYAHTFDLNATISSCTNNFGPYQHEEKLVAKTILRLIQGQPAQIYGTGQHVRDWIYVGTHVKALDHIFHQADSQDFYLVGGENERTNLEIVHVIGNHLVNQGVIDLYDIEFANLRPTDDRRYAVDTSRLRALGFDARTDSETFTREMGRTVAWYLERTRQHPTFSLAV